MRSRSPSRVSGSLALRVTIWYGLSFLVIATALSAISYFYLSSAVRDNRRIILSKLKAVATIAEEYGIDAIGKFENFNVPNYTRRAVFVRVIDSQDRIAFLSTPEIWEEFRTASRSPAVVGIWQYVPSNKDRDVLELMTSSLPGGYLLQAGKEIQDRKEILEHYRDTTIAITSSMILIGLAGGALLAFRALKPVGDLAHTTQAIITTGDIAARVPETNAGGELEELTRLFNRMLERIEKLINGMRETLDNVAHDLRTPITRFRGLAEVALQEQDRSEQREALISCVEESDRILALLNNLMDVSEAETGAMRLNIENVSVASVIRETIDLYEYVAEENNISIAVDCAPGVQVTGDRARMRQVLANLVDNAIKYSQRGGHIWIKATKQDSDVTIAVRDEGCGIPPEERSRIWDRLHRGDRSRSQPGLGLGLSLVRAIVNAHNGRVEVQSAPGQGAVFMVSFPVSSAAV
jgi:signal transduction histidine kinase